MRQRDPLASHNERVKLRSGFLNALGLGFIGFAVLRPLTEGGFAPDAFTLIHAAAGLALHASAHYVLRYLERET